MNTSRRHAVVAVLLIAVVGTWTHASGRPNILLAISDDQSWPHASAYGCKWVRTPAFDRVAREGVLFTHAFASTPGCSPTRASLLTGRHAWQLEHAGTHASAFPKKYLTYPDLLEQAGYFVGYTGKAWGPGNWEISGRIRNPVGPAYNRHKITSPAPGLSRNDYAANFAEFLEACPKDKPFCFWFGSHEPHRRFGKDSWRRAGRPRDDVTVPPFLPDTPEVRGDLLDYALEIEWFDRHLGRMIKQLEETGRLENTLIIVTSDNGMAFPRAKANLYEYGVHMPLAVRWGGHVPGGRTVDDLVGFVDLTATILQAAGVTHPQALGPLPGRSLMPVLTSRASGRVDSRRDAVFAARERHSSSRYRSLGYPQRAVRTRRFLYIRNFKPERWPAGAPQKFGARSYPSSDEVRGGILGPAHGGYHDIDGCPTLDFLIENRTQPDIARYLHLAVDKRPAEELFDIQKDPGCLTNLASDPKFAEAKQRLHQKLMDELTRTGDPRVHGRGDVFEAYPRFSRIRVFPKPTWAEANPQDVPKQEWLDVRLTELRGE